jgi:hypothetical protein
LQPPKHYHLLLGLVLNLFPKSAHTTGQRGLQQVADRFSQEDVYIQMLFAGSPDEYNPKQLLIWSDWEPDRRDSIHIEFQS